MKTGCTGFLNVFLQKWILLLSRMWYTICLFPLIYLPDIRCSICAHLKRNRIDHLYTFWVQLLTSCGVWMCTWRLHDYLPVESSDAPGFFDVLLWNCQPISASVSFSVCPVYIGITKDQLRKKYSLLTLNSIWTFWYFWRKSYTAKIKM